MTRFNYLVCLDIVVLACILVVAGRPDGLAITLSAIIIATGAVLYRCSVSVKSYLSELPRQMQPSPRNDEHASVQAKRTATSAGSSDHRENTRSWLREAE